MQSTRFLMIAVWATSSLAGASEPLSVGRDPQLFLDDFMIAPGDVSGSRFSTATPIPGRGTVP